MKGERRKRMTLPRPTIRLIPPEPPRHLAPISDAHDVPLPPPSQPAPSVSHVARRRVSSAPAHEVELEEIELLDEAPDDDSRPIARTASGPPSLPQPPSFAPTVIDGIVPHAPSVIAASRPRTRPSLAVGGALTLLAIGIAIGATLRTGGTHENASPATGVSVATPTSRVTAPTTPVTTPTPAVPEDIPEVAVSSLPHAAEGTVIGAEGHRLWIDGHLRESFTAVVACGPHVVQVGSAGTPRDVDVPCGTAVTVLP